MVAFTTRMPVGFPGKVTRSDSLTIETHIVDSAAPPTFYGKPVKMVAGLLQPIAGADVIATVQFGILVNPYPTQSSTDAFGAATPPATGLVDVLRRGYIAVLMANGTGVTGAAVYVRKTADTGKLVGDIEDASDSGKCEVLPGAYFMGPKDANNVVEIAYNI